MRYADILAVYAGSNGYATIALYKRLANHGPRGVIATNLFRACKCSERAKVYRGGQRGRGSYRSMAYDRKDWSLDQLCDALMNHAKAIDITWGVGLDESRDASDPYRFVLYVDLPTGQVSFHGRPPRPGCPTYAGKWDGVRGEAPQRICRWVEGVLNPETAEA